MNRKRTRVIQLAVLAALGGCTVGPAYHRPDTDAPQAYKELTAAQFAMILDGIDVSRVRRFKRYSPPAPTSSRYPST